MKVLYSILALLFTSACLMSQGVIEPVWKKHIRSEILKNSESWGVDIDDNGHVYWSVNVNNHGQGLDIICYKYNEHGEELWSEPFIYGGSGTQQSYVCDAKDTALYIGGKFCTDLQNSCDMLLLKVDKDQGEIIWDRTIDFGQDGYEEIDGLVIKEDAIYCGGWAHANEGGIYLADIGLWTLDFQGNTLWRNHFGKVNTAEHHDGHFVVDDDYIYCAGLWGGMGIGNLYNGHSFLGTFDRSNGEFVDSVLFGDQSDKFGDIENALGMTSDGTHLYVTGYTTPDTLDHWQIFVAKFDKDLNMIWMKDWGGSDNEAARAIVVDEGIVYVAGRTASPELIQGGGEEDAVLLAYTTDGELLNYRTWGDETDNAFRDIVIKNDAIYLSGVSISDSPFLGYRASILIKMYKDGIVNVTRKPKYSINIYPNPGWEVINVDLSGLPPNHYLFEIFDINGVLLQSRELINTRQQVSLPMPSGIYPYRISSPKNIMKEGKLVISSK